MGALYGTAGLLDVYRRLANEYRVPLRVGPRCSRPRGRDQSPPTEILLDRVVAMEPGVDPNAWRAAYEKMLAPLPPASTR